MPTKSHLIKVVVFALLPSLAVAALPTGEDVLLAFQVAEPEQSAPASSPAPASVSQAIAVSALLGANARRGDSLRVQLGAADFADFTVTGSDRYINGDSVLHAHGRHQGEDYSLSLTLGRHSLFGYLNGHGTTYQISAVSNGEDFHGWIYQPTGLTGDRQTLHKDYWIADVAAPVLPKPHDSALVLPLQTGLANGSAGSDQQAATSAGISSDNLRITQRLSPSPVIVGESVRGSVQIENISNETHRNLALEIFFFLENSELQAAPSQCREQLSLSLQEVLYCELGDFAPGQSKGFQYEFVTSAMSRPTVYSTVLIGELRVDDHVNVVEDVRHDSDGDGISDFNERLLGTDPFNAADVDLSNSVIDVMAFYTPGSETLYPHGVETRINQLISVANQVYADSGVAITLRPVYHGRLEYNESADMDTTLSQLLNRSHPAFQDVSTLRTRFGGDLVMLLRPLDNETSRCGLAPVGGYSTGGDFTAASELELAFSVIGIDCPDDVVVAHELGHNMGLTHSFREDGTGGTFDFATGYGVDDAFATVMALPAAFNTQTRVAKFSSPSHACLGFTCGIPEGQDQAADAVLTLNTVRHQIAAFATQQVPDLPELTLDTTSGQQSFARIAMAASKDNRLTFTDVVSPGDRLDVIVDIALDPNHVGSEGSVHVLIRTQDDLLFQMDEVGRLVEWDGSVEDLRAAVPKGPLKARQQLTILRGFLLDEQTAGQAMEFYAAYQLEGFTEVVYTSEPLRLYVTK